MASIKGIIFDMDGVLCDSERFICEAACRMFLERYGVRVKEEDFLPFVGAGENRYIGGVAEKYGIKWEQEADKARTYAIYLEIIKGRLPPLPGVVDFIERCRRQGMKLSVASSADRVKVDGNLAEIGVPASTFDACITGNDVERKKPDPEIFLLAAKRLGLSANECVVVEDAPNGVRAAKAAGAMCLGLTTSFSEGELKKCGADWTAPDLATLCRTWSAPLGDVVLLPVPKLVRWRDGYYTPRSGQFIRLVRSELLRAGQAAQEALEKATGQHYPIVAGGPETEVSIALSGEVRHEQGYRLVISPKGIQIVGGGLAGAFYGAQTLAQVLRQFPKAAPAMEIEDEPDFPARGVMLDISRDKVPTMATLYALVDELAAMKINQLQLYTEHTFAYRAHPEVWAEASPMTGQEILELDRYCRERFIDLAPNQNSFGHLDRWLKWPKYVGLAEAPNGFDTPWDHRDYPFSLCPTNPESLRLIEGLYDELLPHFTSELFNVGCDETWDLGQGRSKEQCARRGRERVYLDFLLKIHELVKARGRRMQFWGDIILERPELIAELPKDAIALEWGYEANHPFEKDGALFAKAGVPFYVCPGTSSWLSIVGRTDNAIGNLRSAAENGLKHGAIGYLNTDWGDWGHLQYLPVSYLGFAAGAAYSWSFRANRDLDVAEALSVHVFRDSAGDMGKLACDLGNVYQAIRKQRSNATVLFWRLIAGPQRAREFEGVTRAEYDASEQRVEDAIALLDGVRMDRVDAGLIADEYRNAAAMLRHACRRGRWYLDSASDNPAELKADLRRIIGAHRRLWLGRNRVGGLSDSSRRLEDRLADYGG